MGETLHGLKRSHMCAEVNEALDGKTVTVTGWAHKTRDLGQIVFIALRDRSGIVQIAANEKTVPAEVFEKAKRVKNEFVLAVKGKVMLRTPENINPNMETGKIEILAEEFRILSESEIPPFQVFDEGVNNELRLKYRYLDLRRPEMQRNLLIRHKATKAVRDFLSDNGFVEIETPCMTKGTPEGAKEYIIPSRVFPGNFYVLPQSPQQFKQLLMVAGFDRYFQIARCFRDEDMRADRQPEFTQYDIEMSFVETEDVLTMHDSLISSVFRQVLNHDVELPIKRITYAEAMERFGSDKPDLRFGMELKDITDIVKDSGFEVFRTAIAEGGSVRGINAKGCGGFSRKQLDALQEQVKTFKAKGLMWITVTETGELKTSLSKHLTEEMLAGLAAAFDAKPNDLILLCAGKNKAVFDSLGSLRCDIARKTGQINPDEFKFLWVVDMPLFEYDEEEDKYNAAHHPFTSPMDEDLHLFETNPGAMRAKAYDIVLNGYELGGGSIRIHQRDVQERMFKTLGLSDEDIQARFGHMLEAFKYGAPPHGGIAIGLDRLAMLLAGADNIREVIAFPKTKDAYCPLTSAPNVVSAKQLNELGIEIIKREG